MKLRIILKELMSASDLSQVKLSRLTGIPPQTLNNWLNGQEPRRIAQVKIVAAYFEVSLDYLLFGLHSGPIRSYTFNSDKYEVLFTEITMSPKG